MLDQFSLSGKAAIVTGASRGIGAAIASGFAEAGAIVVGIGRAPNPDAVAAYSYRQCDVTDHALFEKVCDEFAARNNHAIDILVNAAGLTLPAESGDQDVITFDRTIATNLTAAFASIITVSNYMRSQRRGSIINITSIGGHVGMPDNPAYAASKGGLRLLTRAFAVDLGSYGIRVNNIAPGYIRTDMTAASYRDPARNAERRRHMILPRWGEASDVVGAAIFLASEASSYVTGIDIVVDGGWLAKGLT